MKRMVLRWVAMGVFLLAMALVCVRLGEWQLDRLDQRRDQNQTVVDNQDEPPVDYRQLMGEPVNDDQQWRRVEVMGRYTGEQFQVLYRSKDGTPGTEVVAVLETPEHRLLINRGFLPRPPGEPDPEVLPAPPEGDVRLEGFLRRDEGSPDDGAAIPHDHKVRLVNSEALGAAVGTELLPGYVSLIDSAPADPGGLQPLTPPPPTEGNHFSYALQWFTFGIIAVVGIAVLIRADLKDHRRAQERARRRQEKAAATEDSEPVDATPSADRAGD